VLGASWVDQEEEEEGLLDCFKGEGLLDCFKWEGLLDFFKWGGVIIRLFQRGGDCFKGEELLDCFKGEGTASKGWVTNAPRDICAPRHSRPDILD